MKKSAVVARLGIIAAIIFCAFSIDKVLTYNFPISCAVATITVVMTIIQLFDYKTAIFSTTIFGLISFIYSYILPQFFSPYLMEPQVSIFPRVMIGVVSFAVLILMKKLTANKGKFAREFLTSSVAAAAGVLTNTILVITMMQLAKGADVLGTLAQTVIGIFFLIELACAVFIVPVIVKTIKKRVNK